MMRIAPARSITNNRGSFGGDVTSVAVPLTLGASLRMWILVPLIGVVQVGSTIASEPPPASFGGGPASSLPPPPLPPHAAAKTRIIARFRILGIIRPSTWVGRLLSGDRASRSSRQRAPTSDR